MPKDNRELFTLSELEKVFCIEGISKSPAVFDYDKLAWFNAEYIKAMTPQAFVQAAMPYFQQVFGKTQMDYGKLAAILQQRVTQLTQIPEMVAFFVQQPDYDKMLFVNKKSKTNLENAPVMLQAALDGLCGLQSWDHDSIHDCLIDLAQTLEVKNGTVMWPVRIAVSGKMVTPGGAVEILDILGREESLRRMRLGLKKLEDSSRIV